MSSASSNPSREYSSSQQSIVRRHYANPLTGSAFIESITPLDSADIEAIAVQLGLREAAAPEPEPAPIPEPEPEPVVAPAPKRAAARLAGVPALSPRLVRPPAVARAPRPARVPTVRAPRSPRPVVERITADAEVPTVSLDVRLPLPLSPTPVPVRNFQSWRSPASVPVTATPKPEAPALPAEVLRYLHQVVRELGSLRDFAQVPESYRYQVLGRLSRIEQQLYQVPGAAELFIRLRDL